MKGRQEEDSRQHALLPGNSKALRRFTRGSITTPAVEGGIVSHLLNHLLGYFDLRHHGTVPYAVDAQQIA